MYLDSYFDFDFDFDFELAFWIKSYILFNFEQVKQVRRPFYISALL